MEATVPSVDHSIWRYYQDGGKGFASRSAEQMRSTPRMERLAEKETLARAAGSLKREKISGAAPSRRQPNRSVDDAAADRARQLLLGMILRDSAGGESASIPIDEKMFKAQIEKMPSETLQKMAAFFSTVHAGGKTATPPPGKPGLQSLDEELAKRGLSLQLSGKVNNVYLAGANSSWTVNASAGTEAEDDKRPKNDKSATNYKRYNNFGQTVGRFAKNFILGH